MDGYEDVPPGDSVRAHRHLVEIVFAHRGKGEIVLGGNRRRAGAGTRVLIPRGTWIAMRTVESRHGRLLLGLHARL